MAQTNKLTEIPVGNIKFGERPETRYRDLMDQARTYGPIYQLPFPEGKRLVVLSSFALVDEVCNDAFFDKSIELLKGARGLAGDGLFTADTSNPKWRKAHAILMNSFSLQGLRNYLPMMEDIAGQLVERWQRLNPEDEINVVNDMTRLTLDVIGLCGFNYRFQSFSHEEMHPFVQSLARILTSSAVGASPDPKQRRQLQEDLDLLFSTVDRLIQERKASGEEGAKIHDLLNAMLTGVDPQTGEKLDDVNIRDQIMTFLIAGHETTSSLLSTALYFLINQPYVLAKAYEEADRVLGKDLQTPPTYQQVHQLQYISQILRESLRVVPPVPVFVRRAYEDRVLGGTYQISKDDELMVLTLSLHRDRSVWGDLAETFSPEIHFSPEAEQARPANAFKPFGTGQRSCIGRPFALQEAALVLGMILQRFIPFTTRTSRPQIRQTGGAIKPIDFFIQVKPRTEVERVTELFAPGNGAVAPVTEKPQPAEAVQPAPAAVQGSLLVLYGSNMGTCEDLAHRIAADGQAKGLTAIVDTLDAYTDKLPKDGATVIVTSSYNGAPPDNAAAFCKWLQNGVAQDALKGVQYTVFGCGNRDWAATYQKIPKLVDSSLEKYGATRMYRRGEGDASGDFDGEFQAWYTSLWGALAQSLSLDASTVAQPKQQLPLYEVEILRHPHPYPFVNSFTAVAMTVVADRELGGQDGRRSIRHLQVALPAGVAYRTGDHLGVVPTNGAALVKRVADHFGFDEQTVIRLRKREDGRKEGTPIGEPISVYDGLANYVELQDVAKRAQISRMVEYTTNVAERQRLEHLAGESEDSHAAYNDEVLNKRKSVIDLLEEYPSCALPFNIFLELMTPLRPRYYSISSSPLVASDECSITVGQVIGPAKSGHGVFEGVCSNHVHRQKAGNILYAFVQDTKSPFHLPEDTRTPIIMIGPGTGFAPFRGFLQERAMQQKAGQQIGTSLTFFGCQHPDVDYLYREELETFEKDGVTKLYTAFSRLDPQKKVYVMDKIYEHRDEVWQLLQEGAIVYICGDTVHMVPGVYKTFARIYQEKTGKSEQEANQWLDDLTAKNLYMVDIWGR
jgi:cytochrome P450 / NADPH-cytochrome P450 reductase